MPYPETRPDGKPLCTALDDSIRNWFCRSGIDLNDAIAAGVITEASLLALWNIRDDRKAGVECQGLTSASFKTPGAH